MVERSGIIGVVVLFLVTLALSLSSMVLWEVIYRSGDWFAIGML